MNKRARQIEQDMLRVSQDPALFTCSVLGQDIWDKQRQILQSVATHRRTAVKACHASGKTFIAAAAVLWWLAHRRQAIVVTTAPTWTQVERLLWGEIHRLVAGSRIAFPKPTATSLYLGPERYAIGLSTNEGVRFQGFHGNVLIILDEAPGILPEIWEAIHGISAGGDVRILALGNPTVSSGPFYDAFTSQRDSWNRISISAFDTPNLAGLSVEQLLQLSDHEIDTDVRPYLTTRRWVKERYAEWGPGHPLWDARVLGNFPAQAEDALLSLAWLEQAKRSDQPGQGSICAGLDVAGPGEDESCLVIRQGPRILSQESWSTEDPRGPVVAALLRYQGGLASVNVDSIGIGWGMYVHLRDIFGAGVVHAINVGEAPGDSEKYSNLKAELYWGLRIRAQAGDLAGLADDKTIGQLAGIRYKHNARGQVVIESKDDARKRGVKSPDRAEAVMLAFAQVKSHGLFDLWKQQAESLQRVQNPSTGPETITPPSTPPADLGEMQKSGSEDWMDKTAMATRLGKVATAPQQTGCCPTCGNKFLSEYALGNWRCGACGASGTKEQLQHGVSV